MKYLAFYLGLHDSNLCLYDSARRENRYIKSERHFGVKRHRADWMFVAECCRRYNFTPDVVVYSDGDRNGLGSCPADAAYAVVGSSGKAGFPRAVWYNIDHHLAHVLSAWPVTDTQQTDFGVAIDGRGDHDRRVSVFIDPGSLAPASYTTTDCRICHLFDRIGLAMKLKGHTADFAGKIMGAQAYGVPDRAFATEQLANGIEEDLFSLMALPRWEGQPLSDDFFRFQHPPFRNWVATVHFIALEAIRCLFDRYCAPAAKIVYSGGCALNTVINRELAATYNGLVIPPHCYDGGISLGCLEAARLLVGDAPLPRGAFPFIQSDEELGFAGAAVIERAAKALSEGSIVGWLQGNGEIGPRALGHRSILMSPVSSRAKTVLNDRVKHREEWRPFAPAVLFDRQPEVFDDGEFRAYMLHTAAVRDSWRCRIPAAVHVDGTSRIQSVDGHRVPGTESFHALLQRFADMTDVPALLNTSFNAGGKPIVGSRDDAVRFHVRSRMDALVVGNEWRQLA